MSVAQVDVNAAVWRSGRHLEAYTHATLQPAEALILARYREAIRGRVLDVGCGAGRILAYLVLLDADVHGLDISPRMVERCRRRFPDADVRVGDLSDLKAAVAGPFDAILMTDNVLDVFDDADRRRVLADARDLLSADGLLIFSTHNLASREGSAAPAGAASRSRAVAILEQLAHRSPSWMLNAVVRLPRRRANRRRLAPLQYRAADHAVLNDEAHDYELLHYYIGRAAQERQLSQLGFRLVDVLELAGPSPAAGRDGRGPSLYYVAAPDNAGTAA